MKARPFVATVLEKTQLTPHVLSLRLKANKHFDYEPGQFVSLSVPSKTGRSIKRLYSLASPAEMAKEDGLELCVRLCEKGIGSQFLASLKNKDQIEGQAPYGDFHFQTPTSGRQVCFIGTGTGVAPLRAMILSKAFQHNRPKKTLAILGFHKPENVLYKGCFENQNIETFYALPEQAPKDPHTYTGHVTDYLRTLPIDWGWKSTDYYLCGHPDMTEEIIKLLREGHGVSRKAIHREIFWTKR